MREFEWQIMRSLSDVQDDQKALAEIIESVDFTGMNHAQSMALVVFELTRENVRNNLGAARKVAAFDVESGFKEAYRLALLSDLLAEFKGWP